VAFDDNAEVNEDVDGEEDANNISKVQNMNTNWNKDITIFPLLARSRQPTEVDYDVVVMSKKSNAPKRPCANNKVTIPIFH
jgi:hypothetical protein